MSNKLIAASVANVDAGGCNCWLQKWRWNHKSGIWMTWLHSSIRTDSQILQGQGLRSSVSALILGRNLALVTIYVLSISAPACTPKWIYDKSISIKMLSIKGGELQDVGQCDGKGFDSGYQVIQVKTNVAETEKPALLQRGPSETLVTWTLAILSKFTCAFFKCSSYARPNISRV